MMCIPIYFLIVLGYYPVKNLIVQKKLVVDTSVSKTTVAYSSSVPDLSEYTLFFQDDFNGNSLDKKVWTYYRQRDTVNSLIYTPKNATVENGKVYLKINRLNNNYFSGVDLTPKKLFKYGYFEISAKLPRSIGDEAAFWFFAPGMSKTYPVSNPSVNGTEIDVFEYSANNFDNIFYGLHWNGYDYKNGAQVTTSHEYIPGISNGYHTYALEWTPKEYIVYIDNKERIRTDKIISRSPELLILGFGTGGYGGNNYLGPWPDTFAIDYLKIYNRKPEVRIYGDADGYGWISDGLKPGSYNSAQLIEKAVVNNDASSIEVPKGWKVTAFNNDNFKGDSIIFTHDTRSFDQLFDNKISSLKVALK